MSAAPPLDFVTVFTGSHARVTLLQSLLDAEGIPNFVPDRMLKTMDPFITGRAPFDLLLQVPTPYAEAARALVAREFPEPLPPASRALRIRWLWVAVFLITPLVFMLLSDLVEHLAR